MNKDVALQRDNLIYGAGVYIVYTCKMYFEGLVFLISSISFTLNRSSYNLFL